MGDAVDSNAPETTADRLAAVVRAQPALRERLNRRLTVTAKLRLAAEIAAAYLRVRRRLRTEQLPALLRALRGEVREHGAPAWQDADEHVRALRVARAVIKLLPRLPGDTRCLTQALVLVALLARRGIGSTLVIAVAPADELVAHAWVEHGGVPLLPPGDRDLGRLVEL